MGKFPLAAAEPGEDCGGSRCARAAGKGTRCRGWWCPWAAGGKWGAHPGAHRKGKCRVRGYTCTPAHARAESLVSVLASPGRPAGTRLPKAVAVCFHVRA